jgi:hypothetical protein
VKRGARKRQRFEAAGTLVLGRARVEQVSASLPSLWRWLCGVTLLLLAASLAGAVWLFLDNRFYVRQADVVGVVRVSPDAVFRASDLPGLHILWARPDEVEANILAALPSLESAQVVCRLPAECTITVVERRPRMMWDEDGQLWWLDADGVVMQAQGMLAEGWLVRGPLPRDDDGRLDERVRIGLNELWATGVNVSQVLYYAPERGLVITDERGWRVIVGRGTGMVERMLVLERLVESLQARGLTPRFVDVRFPDAPYYSLTNDW